MLHGERPFFLLTLLPTPSRTDARHTVFVYRGTGVILPNSLSFLKLSATAREAARFECATTLRSGPITRVKGRGNNSMQKEVTMKGIIGICSALVFLITAGSASAFEFSVNKPAGKLIRQRYGVQTTPFRGKIQLAPDADGDGLLNEWEREIGTNPLDRDSDDDGIFDGQDGYPLDADNGSDSGRFASVQECRQMRSLIHSGQTGLVAPGYDTDGDGIVDDIEDEDRNCVCDPDETCWYKADTDNDGIVDGVDEYPLDADDGDTIDADGDGLSDALETRLGTDPRNPDTDGDCILDGLEDANRNGVYDVDSETNPLSSDTDGDRLPDGWVSSMGMGEDHNCNGIFDEGVETDPCDPDTDGDTITDFDEMTAGGAFNLDNLECALDPDPSCEA